jgi:Peptidase family M23
MMRAVLLMAALLAAAPSAGFHLVGAPVQGALIRGQAPAETVSLTLDGRPVPFAADGRFILGFDRDAGPRAILTAHFADGHDASETLRVAPRAWRIEHVAMARPVGGPTPEYALLRAGEEARIGAARAQGSDTVGWSQHFIWPAHGPLRGAFGAQRLYLGGVPAAYHSGTDIGAAAGAIVVAPADGVVTLAPPPAFSLEGNLVIIDHGLGLTSAFLHLSRASVRPGDRVRQGQEIGRVGATGRATGPHLHWSLVWNGARIDPAALVGGVP